ncbi:MAG: VTT domain-containing protein [Actinomycetota bacterium]|nr:VTT domain-containing protein [Actinomycetota bacterium]
MLAALFALGPDFLQPEWWFDKAGAAALPVVTAIVFAESGLLIGFFLPGDSLLFFTGFLTSSAAANEAPFDEFARNIPSLPIVLVCLAVAAIAGDQVGYMFGKRVGPALFTRPNSRLFKQENVVKAHDFFEKYGPKSLVLARFIPIVRTFTPIVAGIGQMRYRTFLTYNVLGGLLWAVGVTSLGHVLGEFQFIRDNIELAIVAVVALSLLPVFIELYRARRHRHPGTPLAEAIQEIDATLHEDTPSES